MKAAIEEAEKGFREGGIPIGSVLVHSGRIIGRGHNRRIQKGSVVLHGEMDALENAGRQPASVYNECVIYTTLSPCSMCSGAILLYLAEKFGRSIPLDVVGHMECMSRLFWQVGSAAYLGVVLRISITKGRSSWSTRSTDSQWRRSGSFTFSTSASPDVHSFPEKTIRLPISLPSPGMAV